ncbi:hypothetical protein [Paraburkholderia sp. Clong3]|uniref:hypothetical protein n=1 Tax=Paraburkholderia sp. Clong3 TaxID=2991061 RepID=UPI003D20BD0B
MTMFVERVLNRCADEGVLVARLDIVIEDSAASASILTEAPRMDIGPVMCKSSDCVWDIVLRLLRAECPAFSGP